MTNFTNTTDQVEALYVGYFGRAGDPAGTNFWVGARNSGTPLTTIAASFSVQPEATTKYPYLANPNIANPTDFINQVYLNLFNRVADAAGLAYWTAQLTAAAGKPAAIGNFIQNVISGATGVDSTTITNKVDVSRDFTTKAVNNNLNWTSAVQGQSAVEIAATDDTAASVTAQKAATDAYIAAAPGPAIPLTVNIDNLSSEATNANFSAPLFFNAPSGTFIQTLNNGDTLTATGTGATLTAALQNGGTTTVSMTGIGRMELSNAAGGAQTVAGSITGVTTLANVGSVAAGLVTVGAGGGGGLKTALTTMNVTGSATNGATAAIIAAAALTATTDVLAINLTGPFGTAAAPLQASFRTDGAAGTVGTPQNSYETIDLSASGASGVTLGSAGGGTQSTTMLNVKGAGAVSIFGGAANLFSRLTTIDASTDTGGVTISGALAGGVGLLTNTTNVLTSFKGGSGADSIDLSNFTAAQVQAFAAANLHGGSARDTLILGAAAAQTTTTLNATDFEIVGVAGATSGTYNISKLGTLVDTLTISSPTAAAAALVVTNATTGFTLNAAGATLGVGFLTAAPTLTLTGPTGAADVLNVTLADNAVTTDAFGVQTYNGYETINMTLSAGAGADNYVFAPITVLPTGGAATLNIVDNNGAFTVGTGTVNVGTGTLNISGTGTGLFSLGATTASVIDASGLNTATPVGAAVFTMTANATAAVIITGSNGMDILRGSGLNDSISAGSGVDNLRGNAGADVNNGGAGNDLFFLASLAETQGVGFAAGNTNYANVDKINDFTGNQAAAGDGIVLGVGAAAFGAGITFTGATTTTVTAVTVATAADFTTLAAAVQAAQAGTASTSAAAEIYDVTVTGGAMAGRVMIVNDGTAAITAADTYVSITGITGALHANDFTYAA